MVFLASDTGDLEESNERLGLELIPYKQPSHPGEGRGGGRWSLFPGGFRGEVPTMRVQVCAHMCVVSMCIVDSHVYTGAYYKPNAFLEESIALSDSRSQALVSWVLGALRAPAPGPLHWPLPCLKLLSQLGQLPACRTLWWLPSQASLGRKDHSLPAPCLRCG